MSTCKDCIHEKVCDNLIAHGLPWGDGKYPAEKWCDHFKPTADVVEVVRCKDCICAETLPSGLLRCRLHSVYSMFRNSIFNVKPDDYCSYGERSENGT